jgi:hypothetical protein
LPFTLKTFSRIKFWFDSDIFAEDVEEKCLSNCCKRPREVEEDEDMGSFEYLGKERKLRELMAN